MSLSALAWAIWEGGREGGRGREGEGGREMEREGEERRERDVGKRKWVWGRVRMKE